MPTIYYADIDEFMDLPGLSLLPVSRRERTQRFLRTADKARSLAAGLLVRRLAGQNEPCIGAHGKPYLRNGPCFNLSHSGRFVVLAAADGDVGADIERIRPWTAAIAERCFTESERAWLGAAPDQMTAFYILWTAKESIMKASGAGFTMPPETFCVDPDACCGVDARGVRFFLTWQFIDNHVVCTALETAGAAWELRRYTRAELLSGTGGTAQN